jgi:succinate dehydrogenase / fumarate reductase iron-sulfur subunit
MDTSQPSTVSTRTVTFRIWRQDGPEKEGRFDEFRVPYTKGANVVSCLMEIQRNPVTVDGRKVAPVVWDAACLEEVCGSCAININGRVRMACSALIDKLEQPITLEPMKKFPVMRDLAVDRTRMFEALKRVKGWIPIDGTHNLGPGPKQSRTRTARKTGLPTRRRRVRWSRYLVRGQDRSIRRSPPERSRHLRHRSRRLSRTRPRTAQPA